MALLIVTGISAPPTAAAQSGSVDVAGGYSFLRDNDLSENFPTGWFASVAGGVNSWLAIAGEVSGNYKTFNGIDELDDSDVKLKVHFFGGGPRFVGHSGTVHPFGQVLFGAVRGTASFLGESESGTNFAWQPGAGVDFDLSGNLGLRVGANGRFIQADGETSKEFQVVVGIVFRNRR